MILKASFAIEKMSKKKFGYTIHNLTESCQWVTSK